MTRRWNYVVAIIGVLIALGGVLVSCTGPSSASPSDPYPPGTNVVWIDVGGTKIPCITYVNEYHGTNGAAISCDWRGRNPT